MNIPSPLPLIKLTGRIILRAYFVFDLFVLLTLLGFARIMNWFGLIRFGWIVIHWWRGDVKR